MESLELCTHWVMECFVAIHYTAKAFYVLGISIWGLGEFVRVPGKARPAGNGCSLFPLRLLART